MRSLFAVGTILIACASNIQATESFKGKEGTFQSSGSGRLPIQPNWTYGVTPMSELLKPEIESFLGRDSDGTLLSINSKTDDELRALARRLTKFLKKRLFCPSFYEEVISLALGITLPLSDFKEFNMGTRTGILFYEVVDDEACKVAKPYNPRLWDDPQ